MMPVKSPELTSVSVRVVVALPVPLVVDVALAETTSADNEEMFASGYVILIIYSSVPRLATPETVTSVLESLGSLKESVIPSDNAVETLAASMNWIKKSTAVKVVTRIANTKIVFLVLDNSL